MMKHDSILKHRRIVTMIFSVILLSISFSNAQGIFEQTHERGILWENVTNDGFIGSLGAWDYMGSWPLGFYPGFDGYVHPSGGESNAVDILVNSNMHNFRSGIWIVSTNMLVPGLDDSPAIIDYEAAIMGWQGDPYGVEETRMPLFKIENYIEDEGFDPLLPEEIIIATWNTNTGITITRRSCVWSYPGYRDFIIYDYSFKNTGQIVSNYTSQVIPDFPEQDLEEVWFAFHSGIAVSTKSNLNFHSELEAVQAGGFGWLGPFHDFYHLDEFDGTVFVNNDGGSKGELVYSTNVNGGKEPNPIDTYPLKDESVWKAKFGDELMDPAAFGWLALYADPTEGSPRPDPKPDVLRIDSHKNGSFKGKDLDLERFNLRGKTKQDFYDFVTTPDKQDDLGNNGDRMNFYTFSYGPYSIPYGDSVRIILAEIAGAMDYKYAVSGDTLGYFPDSTIAAIRKNALFARQAVAWGRGVEVYGIPLAADAPEPPPSPAVNAANASVGIDTPMIAVTWDNRAETRTITDGSGNVFYGGLVDLDGYKVYRSTDFQYTNDTEPPAFRGATWDLYLDLPKAEFADYWDEELEIYKLKDDSVKFDFRYGYYVAPYTLTPAQWTSANGTVVDDLPALEGGSQNRTLPTAAVPGPVNTFDIFVSPNPYVFNDPLRSFGLSDPYKMVFRNLPVRCTIRIYTISGDLVRTLVHKPDEVGNVSGSEAWNQKTESGLLVAPGLYIYHIESNTVDLDNNLTGKLMIIR
ncbi:MAG: hypothetical protein H8E14_12285 [Candidatus Marinimicrobia bacterium]|nr:hypothetical protein [Candidatus Neomarinimicrobiota bacterium]